MVMINLRKKLLASFLVVAFIVLSTGTGQVLAQGTSIEIEGRQINEGDSTELTVTLTKAMDGLGRLDAAIVSSNPQVLELNSITPDAVSSEFFQVDSQAKDRIKFKLVDLRKRVNPGDENVKLLTVTVKGVKAGTSELSLEEIKFSDEDGDLIEPTVGSSKVTVGGREKTATETKESEKEADNGEEEGEEEKEVPEKQDEETEKVTEEPDSKPEVEVKSGDYSLTLTELKLKLGTTGQTRLTISSLSGGFRTAQVWITNPGGITFGEVSFLDPTYSQIVNKTERLVTFRVVDFDDEINQGSEKLNVADISVNAVKVGDTNLRVKKLEIRTDGGEKIVREGNEIPVTVTLGPIGSSTNPPRDLNEDGLYEDINGDGELTRADAFALAFNLESKSVRESTSLFDFDWDGTVTFNDAVALIREIE